MSGGAEKELERIERKLDSSPPSGKPPVKRGCQSGSPDEPSRNNHLDAVGVGAALLGAIAFITLLGESLSPKQQTQLTAASMGGAARLLVATASSESNADPPSKCEPDGRCKRTF